MKTHKTESPWFIKILQGFGGWLGAIFLVIFTGMLIEDYIRNDDTSYLIIGLILTVLTIFISFKEIKSYFLNQFILALFLTGQGLVLFWIMETFEVNYTTVLILISFFQGLSYFFIKNYAAKFITSLFSITTFSMLISSYGYSFTVLPLLFFTAFILLFKFIDNPISFSSTITLLISPFISFKLWMDFSNEIDGLILLNNSFYYYLLQSGILSVLLILLLFKLFNFNLLKALCIGVIAGIINFFIPGIVIAITIMFLGFYLSNRFLAGLGILSSLFYLSYYYYDLQVTLFSKSIILILTGIIALLTRWVLLKKGALND